MSSKEPQDPLDFLDHCLENWEEIRKGNRPWEKEEQTGADDKKTEKEENEDVMKRVTAAVQAVGERVAGEKKRPQPPPEAVSNFTARLFINDLPQKVRANVTRAKTLGYTQEITMCSIDTKGKYYPEGVEPGPGEPEKLNLVIEGKSQEAVDAAVEMLKKLMGGRK